MRTRCSVRARFREIARSSALFARGDELFVPLFRSPRRKNLVARELATRLEFGGMRGANGRSGLICFFFFPAVVSSVCALCVDSKRLLHGRGTPAKYEELGRDDKYAQRAGQELKNIVLLKVTRKIIMFEV